MAAVAKPETEVVQNRQFILTGDITCICVLAVGINCRFGPLFRHAVFS